MKRKFETVEQGASMKSSFKSISLVICMELRIYLDSICCNMSVMIIYGIAKV